MEKNFSCITAGNSYTHAITQTGPVISVPESERIINAYPYPSNKSEMIKKKRLTSGQLASLEQSFQGEIKLDSDRKLKLSRELGLHPRQIAVWFQNRRARWKAKQLEQLYDSLRQEYDIVSREKQMLHEEVCVPHYIVLKYYGLSFVLSLNFLIFFIENPSHKLNCVAGKEAESCTKRPRTDQEADLRWGRHDGASIGGDSSTNNGKSKQQSNHWRR